MLIEHPVSGLSFIREYLVVIEVIEDIVLNNGYFFSCVNKEGS